MRPALQRLFIAACTFHVSLLSDNIRGDALGHLSIYIYLWNVNMYPRTLFCCCCYFVKKMNQDFNNDALSHFFLHRCTICAHKQPENFHSSAGNTKLCWQHKLSARLYNPKIFTDSTSVLTVLTAFCISAFGKYAFIKYAFGKYTVMCKAFAMYLISGEEKTHFFSLDLLQLNASHQKRKQTCISLRTSYST